MFYIKLELYKTLLKIKITGYIGFLKILSYTALEVIKDQVLYQWL